MNSDRTDNFYVSVLIKNAKLSITQAKTETNSRVEGRHSDQVKHSWLDQKRYSKTTDDVVNTKDELPYLHRIDTLGSQLSSILGLDELEANIYLNLLRVGPISASALAKEIDVERTKTYRTIERLHSQSIVSTTFSKPKLCVAKNPEEVLKMITQRKEDELKKLKMSKKDVIKKIKDAVPTNCSTQIPTFHIIQGKANIYSAIGKLLEDSSEIVYIVTNLKDISRMYHTSIPEKIKICENNGGQVHLLTELYDKRMIPFVNRFGASETRLGRHRSKGRMIVRKGKQMIMSDATINENENTSSSDFAFSTNSNEMVNNIYTLCSLLWQNSKPIKLAISK